MGYLPNISAPEMADSASGHHYHTLIELSASARRRGEHQAAQQYATAAHKWAMEEHARLQRLVVAREALAVATRVIETAWDKDRTCTSIAELRERHPEFTRMITAWESAQQAVDELG